MGQPLVEPTGVAHSRARKREVAHRRRRAAVADVAAMSSARTSNPAGGSTATAGPGQERTTIASKPSRPDAWSARLARVAGSRPGAPPVTTTETCAVSLTAGLL